MVGREFRLLLCLALLCAAQSKQNDSETTADAAAAPASASDAAALEGCGPGNSAGPEEYDLRLHMAGVGLMLLASLAGAMAPVALHLSSSSRAVTTTVRLGTYFGFGTILATALIHMLPPAAESLASPCLPSPFRGGSYGAWAYLFVLLAMLGMHLVDFLLKSHFLRRQQRQQLPEWHGSSGIGSDLVHEGCPSHAAIASALTAGSKGAAARPQAADHEHQQQARWRDGAAAEEGLGLGSGSSSRERHGSGRAGGGEGADCYIDAAHWSEAEGQALLPSSPDCGQQQNQRQGQGHGRQLDTNHIIGLMLTEAGIIFHSAMIGLTLGVTGGPAFPGLLAALCMHQFFEGFAIGSTAVDAGLAAGQAAAMGAAYAVTTPAGMVAGITLRESLDQGTPAALLASGICDAVSAGVLLYVALVELLPAMTASSWLRSRRWPLQVAAFCAFYAGAGVMALLGKWA
ncbi:hypothetical protein ABPG75_008423 [Micractinium tetrahymenae]